MAKPKKTDLLSGIDLGGLDVPEIIEEGKKIAEREAPHIKAGFRQIESETGTAIKKIYDWLAGDDENDTERDILGKL